LLQIGFLRNFDNEIPANLPALCFVYFKDVLTLEHTIRRVKSTETFTGKGYFTVTRTTITAMVSTTITYLIVILQS
jgi:hypothetical protein